MRITPQFLEKYNKPGPRYTSYPPATNFHDRFTQNDFIQSIKSSNNPTNFNFSLSSSPSLISFYIHIPFCPQRCYFCGCNTTEYKSEETINKYIVLLLKEIDSFASYMDNNRLVSQIHWGGGTPNAIKYEHIERVMDNIYQHFKIADKNEVSIECNPAYLEYEHINQLSDFGFNRISLGIQDFHPEVLKAINRRHSKYPLEDLVNHIKSTKINSINFDLVYGLPLQNLDSYKENIDKTISLSPDRIATFSYAHVPWFNKLQKSLENYYLPNPEEKLSMLITGLEMFTSNGYVSVGMDHFAKPADDLALAKLNKRLHRNFQGYCTKETTAQVYAFGASSISQLWNCYSQNKKGLESYMQSIEEKGFAVDRGYLLSKDEIIVREVINELMCNGYLNFNDIALQFNLSPVEIKQLLKFNPDSLKEFIDDGLLELNDNTVQVNANGMFVIRNIAMCFDPFLVIGDSQFSKTV